MKVLWTFGLMLLFPWVNDSAWADPKMLKIDDRIVEARDPMKKAVILSGYSDLPSFAFSAEKAGDALARRGYSIYTAAGYIQKPSWGDFLNRTLKGADQASLVVRNRMSKVRQNGTAFFTFLSHGSPKEEKDNSPGLVIAKRAVQKVNDERGTEKYSFDRFRKDVVENSKPNVTVKILSENCFGGGVHGLALSLPRACAVSVTTEKTIGWTGFTTEFFKEVTEKKFDVDADGTTSMLEAFFGGIMGDRYNVGRQGISSLDFAQRIVKSGPYTVTYELEAFASYNPADPHRVIPSLGRDLRNRRITRNRSDLSYPKMESVPEPVRSYFLKFHDKLRDKINTWKSGKDSESEVFESKIDAWLKEFDQINSKISNMPNLEPIPWYLGLPSIRVLRIKKQHEEQAKELWRLTARKNEIDDLIGKEFGTNPGTQVLAYRHWQKLLDSLDQFYKVATPEQKIQMEKLLACEMEAL